MKRSFFQAAVTSILLYGCTTWTLTKRLEKKLHSNYIRMLRSILNKSWRQHPTRHQLYGHLPPITKTIQVRRTRHARHCWRSRDPHTWPCKSRTTSMNIHSAAMWGYGMFVLNTCLGRWTIGRSGERGSGIFVLPARHDDDDIYIYIYIKKNSLHWSHYKFISGCLNHHQIYNQIFIWVLPARMEIKKKFFFFFLIQNNFLVKMIF